MSNWHKHTLITCRRSPRKIDIGMHDIFQSIKFVQKGFSAQDSKVNDLQVAAVYYLFMSKIEEIWTI